MSVSSGYQLLESISKGNFVTFETLFPKMCTFVSDFAFLPL